MATREEVYKKAAVAERLREKLLELPNSKYTIGEAQALDRAYLDALFEYDKAFKEWRASEARD